MNHQPDQERELTDHLTELRRRLMLSAFVVFAFFLMALPSVKYVLAYLQKDLVERGLELNAFGVADPLMIYLNLALVIGLVASGRFGVRLLLVVPARPRYLDGPRARPRTRTNHRGQQLLHVLVAADNSVRSIVPTTGRHDVLDPNRCRDPVLLIKDSKVRILRPIRDRGIHHTAGFDVAPYGVVTTLLPI